MVEAVGVEPTSGKLDKEASTGIAYRLNFAARTADRRASRATSPLRSRRWTHGRGPLASRLSRRPLPDDRHIQGERTAYLGRECVVIVRT